MKNRLITLAFGLALVALLGHFYAKPLLAQVRAAVIQNMDEPGRNSFQIKLFTDDGTGVASFTVPAGKRYIVEAFAGYCFSPNTGIDLLGIENSSVVGAYVPVYKASVFAGGYFGNGLVKLYGAPGETIRAVAGRAEYPADPAHTTL